MKALTPEELRKLREETAGLGIPQDHQDELIRLIDAIVISWIEQAFGLSPAQLSLSERAKRAFCGADTHAKLNKHHNNNQGSDRDNGEMNHAPRSKRQPEP